MNRQKIILIIFTFALGLLFGNTYAQVAAPDTTSEGHLYPGLFTTGNTEGTE